MRHALRRLRTLGFGDWLLLAEATLLVTAAAAAIAFLSFARIARMAGGPLRWTRDERLPSPIPKVRWAVEAAARRAPFRAKCFETGLAAHWMLRRRGVASTMYYGAAMGEGGLLAHVWVRVGDRDVVGCTNAGDFAELMRFPA